MLLADLALSDDREGAARAPLGGSDADAAAIRAARGDAGLRAEVLWKVAHTIAAHAAGAAAASAAVASAAAKREYSGRGGAANEPPPRVSRVERAAAFWAKADAEAEGGGELLGG